MNEALPTILKTVILAVSLPIMIFLIVSGPTKVWNRYSSEKRNYVDLVGEEEFAKMNGLQFLLLFYSPIILKDSIVFVAWLALALYFAYLGYEKYRLWKRHPEIGKPLRLVPQLEVGGCIVATVFLSFVAFCYFIVERA